MQLGLLEALGLGQTDGTQHGAALGRCVEPPQLRPGHPQRRCIQVFERCQRQPPTLVETPVGVARLDVGREWIGALRGGRPLQLGNSAQLGASVLSTCSVSPRQAKRRVCRLSADGARMPACNSACTMSGRGLMGKPVRGVASADGAPGAAAGVAGGGGCRRAARCAPGDCETRRSASRAGPRSPGRVRAAAW